jgi:hypothetical protein
MAAGDLTVTLVGSYNTMALAIAAMDAGNDAAATDSHQLFIEPGIGPGRYKVIKYVRAAA